MSWNNYESDEYYERIEENQKLENEERLYNEFLESEEYEIYLSEQDIYEDTGDNCISLSDSDVLPF